MQIKLTPDGSESIAFDTSSVDSITSAAEALHKRGVESRIKWEKARDDAEALFFDTYCGRGGEFTDDQKAAIALLRAAYIERFTKVITEMPLEKFLIKGGFMIRLRKSYEGEKIFPRIRDTVDAICEHLWNESDAVFEVTFESVRELGIMTPAEVARHDERNTIEVTYG